MTNGRTQRVRLGGLEVRFLNRGPKTMEVKGQLAAHIIQALRYLGQSTTQRWRGGSRS